MEKNTHLDIHNHATHTGLCQKARVKGYASFQAGAAKIPGSDPMPSCGGSRASSESSRSCANLRNYTPNALFLKKREFLLAAAGKNSTSSVFLPCATLEHALGVKLPQEYLHVTKKILQNRRSGVLITLPIVNSCSVCRITFQYKLPLWGAVVLCQWPQETISSLPSAIPFSKLYLWSQEMLIKSWRANLNLDTRWSQGLHTRWILKSRADIIINIPLMLLIMRCWYVLANLALCVI